MCKVLLFVFWYCHKRGREVRLEKERLLTEAEIAVLDDDAPITSSDATPMTTAPTGASIEQVEAGMREAEVLDQQQRGRGQYAGDGSSAQELRREEREKAMLSHAARSGGINQR